MVAIPKRACPLEIFTAVARLSAGRSSANRFSPINFLLILRCGFASYRADLYRGLIEAQARAGAIPGAAAISGFSPQFQQLAVRAWEGYQ